ncbi:MAG: hypothetical protein F7C34_01910 [Desulfurococcales archaeon]|nr:hypothetical protein [Desulfurococcales archaeon]
MKNWLTARRIAVERLREHARKGLVDRDILGFLLEFNEKHHCAFTTSSCSGRLAVIEGPSIFDKRGARILAQTHDPSDCEPLLKAVRGEPSPGAVRWLSLQPPILHFAALTLDTAQRIASIADQSGFNRSCYKKYRPGGFHVEVAASDKLTILKPEPGDVELACRALAVYKGRLERLTRRLLEEDICGARSAATPSPSS